ncbi:MAG: hypothetical protein HQM09_08615 [Candidatus Riflebacteria bacterium]|nr:hypothetical protein [Candidatus Riflebacteria bacterium]
MHRSHRTGSALIILLLGILIMGLLYAQQGKMLVPGKAVGEPNPMERAWDAVCKANKAMIQAALPMYNMNHEPMKVLDMKKLAEVMNIPKTDPSCPCKYKFDATGKVVCETHH